MAMLTPPALRIDELTIDFNAKLTSVETASVNDEFAASAELGINYKVVNFKASASYKRTSSRGTSVEKTYNLGVKVTAVNDGSGRSRPHPHDAGGQYRQHRTIAGGGRGD